MRCACNETYSCPMKMIFRGTTGSLERPEIAHTTFHYICGRRSTGVCCSHVCVCVRRAGKKISPRVPPCAECCFDTGIKFKRNVHPDTLHSTPPSSPPPFPAVLAARRIASLDDLYGTPTGFPVSFIPGKLLRKCAGCEPFRGVLRPRSNVYRRAVHKFVIDLTSPNGL